MLLYLVFVLGCFFAGLLATPRLAPRRTRVLVAASLALAVVYYAVGWLDMPALSLGGAPDDGELGEAPPTEAEDLEALRAWGARLRGEAGVETDAAEGEDAGGSQGEPREVEGRVPGAAPGAAGSSGAFRVAGWLVFVAGLGAIAWRPRIGVYLVVFFALAGDSTLAPPYPFIKGFSSRESILFLHDALIVSPLEVYLLATALAWLVRRRIAGEREPSTETAARPRGVPATAGPLAVPAAIFLLFVGVGLVRGLAAGGDVTIGFWESRPLVHLVVVGVLAHLMLDERRHVTHLMWVAVAALAVEGVWGTLSTLEVIAPPSRIDLGSVTDHSASIHVNAAVVLALAAWIYRGVGLGYRLGVPLLLPPMLFTYLASQRRAAFLALGIACVLLLVVLWRERPRLARVLLPALVLTGAVYLGAFWHSSSPLGLPARAVKSVVASEQASEKDQGSNAYRRLEHANIRHTMHEHPVLGVGFGRPFEIVRPMPDIGFAFEWWAYITHNSVLWIWLKTGAVGFVVLLVLFGTAIVTGGRVVETAAHPELRAALLAITLYLTMHAIYAWVDMSWDTASMVLVGAGAGVVNRRAASG